MLAVGRHVDGSHADLELDPCTALSALGLDSMALVSLLLDLEETFDFQIPDELLSARTFETATSLWDAIEPLLEARADPSSPAEGHRNASARQA